MLPKVLETINEGRKALDLHPLAKLPKGVPASNCGCVIARCFNNAHTNDTNIYLPAKGSNPKPKEIWGTLVEPSKANLIVGHEMEYVVRLPTTLADFVEDFDTGHYPELLDVPIARTGFQILAVGTHYEWFYPPFMFESVGSFPTLAAVEADIDKWMGRYNSK